MDMHARRVYNNTIISIRIEEKGANSTSYRVTLTGASDVTECVVYTKEKIADLFASTLALELREYAKSQLGDKISLFIDPPNYKAFSPTHFNVLLNGIDGYLYSMLLIEIKRKFQLYLESKNILESLMDIVIWDKCLHRDMESTMYVALRNKYKDVIKKCVSQYIAADTAYKNCSYNVLEPILLSVIEKEMRVMQSRAYTKAFFEYTMQDNTTRVADTPISNYTILNATLADRNLVSIGYAKERLTVRYDIADAKMAAIFELIQFLKDKQIEKGINRGICSQYRDCSYNCMASKGACDSQECKQLCTMIIYGDYTFGLVYSANEILLEYSQLLTNKRPLPYVNGAEEEADRIKHFRGSNNAEDASQAVLTYITMDEMSDIRSRYPKLTKLLNLEIVNFKKMLIDKGKRLKIR